MDRRVSPPTQVTSATWGHNDHGDGNEKGKNAIGWIGVKTTLHVHRAFLYTARWQRRENA